MPSIRKDHNLLANEVVLNDRLNARIIMPTWTTNAAGTVINRNTDSISCYLSEDFGFSLGNSWQPLASFDDLPFFSAIKDNFNLAAAVGAVEQGNPESKYMTSASWKGSQIPVFSFNALFVSTEYGYNPIDDFLNIARGALPISDYNYAESSNSLVSTIGGAVQSVVAGGIRIGYTALGSYQEIQAGNRTIMDIPDILSEQWQTQKEESEKLSDKVINSGLKAPLGYGLQGNVGVDASSFMEPLPNTTISLHVGNWFVANKLVLNDLSGISFSKEVIAPNPSDPVNDSGGYPLCIRCNISLRPIRAITFQEFLQYFVIRGVA